MFENPGVSAKPEEQVHTHLQRGAWDVREFAPPEKKIRKRARLEPEKINGFCINHGSR